MIIYTGAIVYPVAGKGAASTADAAAESVTAWSFS